MSNIVGINQRISFNIASQAIDAVLNDTYTLDFAADLAATEFNGPNIIKKVQHYIGKLTARNPLLDYVKEHRSDYKTAIKLPGDKAIIYTALINAAYPFGYEITSLLGKYFNIQDEISINLIKSKLAVNYSNNRAFVNGINSIIPMYVDAGLIIRDRIGVYKKSSIDITTDFSSELYLKSFMVNNPHLSDIDETEMKHPYMEFLKPSDM